MNPSAVDEPPAAPQASSLLGSWVYVFVGFTAARVLGFLFSVAATRLLPKAEFGELAYALTISALASVFLSSAPVGLSRYLTLHRADRGEQNSYYSNWVFMCALLLVASLLVTPVIGFLSGLSPALTLGVAATLIGVAALETNREAQRGADQYFEMAAMYVLSNLVQLVVVIALGVAGIRSAAVYLLVYGLAPLAMLVPVQLLRPVGFQLRLRLLSRARMVQIFTFSVPLLLQSIGFAVWYGADVVLLRNIAGAEITGGYGAAKTMATVVVMPATALALVLLPRAARFGHADFRWYLVMAGSVTAAVTLPLALAMSVLGRVLVLLVFGAKYEDAASALVTVPFAMAFWGIYQVMANLWVGRGKPTVDLYCTLVGVAATLVTGVMLVPDWGMVGAALAFTIGSGVRLASVVAYSARAFRSEGYVAQIEAERPSPADGAGRPILFLGDPAGRGAREDYATFMARLVQAVGEVSPMVIEPSGFESAASSSVSGRLIARMRATAAASRWIRLHQPRAIVFGSPGGVTLTALVLARALRSMATPAPIVMVAMRAGTQAQRPPRWWGRWLFPELVLVESEAEMRALEQRGARVDLIWGGVDHFAWDAVAQRLLALTRGVADR